MAGGAGSWGGSRFPGLSRVVGVSCLGLGFRAQGSGLRAQGSEFRVQGLGFGVACLASSSAMAAKQVHPTSCEKRQVVRPREALRVWGLRFRV